MARVVVTGKIPSGGLERLKAEHEVTAWEKDDAITRSELLTMVAGADAIVSDEAAEAGALARDRAQGDSVLPRSPLERTIESQRERF